VEIDFDGDLHATGTPSFFAGFKLPGFDGFDGFFVEAQSQGTGDADIVRPAVGADGYGEPDFALVLGLAGFLGVFRLGRESGYGALTPPPTR